MNTRLDRLIQLNERTDDLVEFKKLYDPATGEWVDDGTGTNRAASLAVGAGVLGVGGYAAQRAVTNAGGYGAVANNVRTRVQPAITAARDRITAARPRVAAATSSIPTKVAGLLAKLAKARKGRFGFESREQRLIQLHSAADKLLQLEAK